MELTNTFPLELVLTAEGFGLCPGVACRGIFRGEPGAAGGVEK